MMNFEQTLEKFQTEDPIQIMEALKQVDQESLDAAAEASKARKAYFADVETKQAAVNERIAALTGQRDEIQKKIDAFREPLILATVSHDTKRLEAIQADMMALEADKVQLNTEIEMLASTHIVGDKLLYLAVLEKADHHVKLLKAYQAAKKRVFELACKREETYHKIQNETLHWNIGGGYPVNLDELNRHFNFEEYAQLEERSAVQQAADAEAAKTVKPQIAEYFRRADPEPAPEPVQIGKTIVQNPEAARRDYSRNRR